MKNNKKTISASEVNKYVYCPYQWYYERYYGKKYLKDLYKKNNKLESFNKSNIESNFKKGNKFHKKYYKKYKNIKYLKKLFFIFMFILGIFCGIYYFFIKGFKNVYLYYFFNFIYNIYC